VVVLHTQNKTEEQECTVIFILFWGQMSLFGSDCMLETLAKLVEEWTCSTFAYPLNGNGKFMD
jgi:hypothetical protein